MLNAHIVKQTIWQTIGFFTLFGLALFLPAGNVAWLAGWVFLILFFGFFVTTNNWLLKYNPGLLQERMSLSRPDQKGWDKILFPLILVSTVIWLIFMSLDASRFHWSPLPAWLQMVGVMTLLSSFYILYLTFRENSYLSTVVRIQRERGHRVISTGPYHWVRHPMYSGILIFMVGTSLLLGSGYGVLIGMIFILVLARRAVQEERTLRVELTGYASYMAQVKYRLIPYVW